ncbi:MAG: HAD-IA family hydrolase [Verrucomicrobia bacterium]|nr:HAD-IA family hydrolase [Verrucomicrobiota bacterium]
MSPTPPRTLIFDLSEVIIAGIVGLEHALAARLGLPPADLLAGFAGAQLDDLCRGRTAEEEYLRFVLARAGWTISPDQLAALLRANFQVKIPGTEPILRALAPHHQLVLLSDHCREWIAYIEQAHPLLALFARRFYSFELGSLKKEPVTFATVLARLDRAAADCLLVDDSATNIAVAARCGLRTIRFTNAADLLRQLRAQGLAVVPE